MASRSCGLVVLITFLAAGYESCLVTKCECWEEMARCWGITHDDNFLQGLESVRVLAFEDSEIHFRSDFNASAFKVEGLQITKSSYSIGANFEGFPRLRFFSLLDTSFSGFPTSSSVNIVSLSGCANLIGASVDWVLAGIRTSFPRAMKLTLNKMRLRMTSKDAERATPVKFDNLKTVDLSHNSIQTILVLESIADWWTASDVILSHNSIQHVSLEDIHTISHREFLPNNTVSVTFGQQSLVCSCELYDFQRWLAATEIIRDPDSIPCTPRHNDYHLTLPHTHRVMYEGMCDPINRSLSTVELIGIGQVRSSLAALCLVVSVITLLALLVCLCHHAKLGHGAARMRDMYANSLYNKSHAFSGPN